VEAPLVDDFIVARNPDASSSLPYLVRLPIDGGLWLKARSLGREPRAFIVNRPRFQVPTT